MTTRISDGAPLDNEPGRPVDITTLREDDLLLDRLGRGEDVTDGDAVVSTLSRWRAALPGDDVADPMDDELLAAALAVLQPARRTRRVARRSAAVSVAAVLAFGALAAASEHAEPNSLLWPITQLMYHDRAEERAAAAAAADGVSAARTAIDGGRYDEAARLLDDAATAVERMGAGPDADRLRDDIAVLRGRIPAGTETTADPPGPVPSSGMPRSVVPSSPVGSLPSIQVPSTVGPTAVPPVPVNPGPPLVSVVPLPTVSLPISDGPIGLGH